MEKRSLINDELQMVKAQATQVTNVRDRFLDSNVVEYNRGVARCQFGTDVYILGLVRKTLRL